MARTAGIRFRQAGKIFYYNAGDLDLPVSSYVVVESAHGLAVGRVVVAPDQVIANDGVVEADLKPIVRIATEGDVEQMEAMNERAREAVLQAKAKVSENQLDMSIASGEFDLDGSQFTAYFTATERVDFRSVSRDLSRDLGTRVQMLQVGDRDRAKLTDGFDICGERLCCSSWMTNFPSVSIRMAKEQDLPLTPQKISGVCGRLYCCLTFEYEDYKALRGTLPKVGSFLSTPGGEAKVVSIDFNREVVKLYLTEAREMVEVAAIDFQLQHGVTIRPMELVRKIEGPLRTVTEDSSAGLTRLPPSRGAGRRERPAATGDRPAQPSGRQGQAPGRPGQPSGRPGQSSGRPPQQRGPRAQATPPPPPAATPQPGPTAANVDGEARKPRRRRRRGRGRGQGGGAGGEAPTSE